MRSLVIMRSYVNFLKREIMMLLHKQNDRKNVGVYSRLNSTTSMRRFLFFNNIV